MLTVDRGYSSATAPPRPNTPVVHSYRYPLLYEKHETNSTLPLHPAIFTRDMVEVLEEFLHTIFTATRKASEACVRSAWRWDGAGLFFVMAVVFGVINFSYVKRSLYERRAARAPKKHARVSNPMDSAREVRRLCSAVERAPCSTMGTFRRI